MKIHALWASASVLALGPAGAATAQPAVQAQAKDDSTQVEQVVVTAERRTTNLQTTAIAATVLRGDDIQKKGVITVDQLMFAAPSLTVNNFGQGVDFNIRGIGKAEHNSQTTTGVITYRDGVATFPGYFQEEPFYDIGDVEILRGPQGTFVGQNATGGAVFITSRDPNIEGGYHGYAQGQLGNYGDVGAQGALNFRINKTFAARVALNTEFRDSFYKISGPWTGDPGRLRSGSGRLGMLWQPNNKLKVVWKTDVNYLDLGAIPSDPVLATNDPFHIGSNFHYRAIDRFVRSDVRADYALAGGVTLRSVSGYQRGRTLYSTDLDGTGNPGGTTFQDAVDEEIFSEEINLISPDDRPITWILGAYYNHDVYHFPRGRLLIGLPLGFFDYIIEGSNPKEASAVFGQMSFQLPDNFQLQAGLRYTTSETTNHAQVRIPQFGILLPDDQSLKESKLTGKLALNWTPDDHNFFYGFVATGFRPGGLNVPGGLTLPAPFRAETVNNYEVGWKRGWMGGRVRTQLDAYYNDYKNFQVIIGNPTNPTASTELNNSDSTKIYGFEAQLEAVFGRFSLDAGLGALHSELGTFFAVDPRAGSASPCNPTTGPATASCINLTGNRQTYAPNFTFNIGGQYAFDLSNGDTMTPRLNYGHVSEQWATLFENRARGDLVEERNIVNAQIAWTHKTIVTTLYGTNLTDQHYVGAVNSGLRFVGPPRQFGVRLLKVF